MNVLVSVILVAAALLWLLGLGGFAVVSFCEGERRAARVAFAIAAFGGGAMLAAAALPAPLPAVAGMLLTVALIAGAGWMIADPGARPEPGGRPDERVDERDIMFARGRLTPGSPEYESYYAMRPQNRRGDDQTRSLPGLLSPAAELADPISFAAAEACFDLTEAVRHHVDGPVAAVRTERPPEEWSSLVKRFARTLGAVDVGVAEMQHYHVYSHVGRGSGVYGEPVELDHPWAVAFTVEMDHRRVAHAPAPPVVEESARQYVEGAKIALILAAFIRRLGYRARAHIDGNYRVIAPLVARDAGLGEIGRMGLLMTSRLGPRVRLGVVTTDLPLAADAPGDDPAVIDFCLHCRKCAVNCPVGAIPSGERLPIGNGSRWSIDSETCFRFWNVIGTDCATCVRVCPYSHPDSPVHNLVRWTVARSGPARRAMVWLDDVFFGRRVPPVATIDVRSKPSGGLR